VGNPVFATLRGTGCRTVQTRTLTATTVITYAYDPTNRLDYFYEDGVLTDLDWDANPLRCEDFMGISYLKGQILTEYEVGAWAYVAPDALGSVRHVMDAAGQVTLAQSYDPFGVLISQSTNFPIYQSTNFPVSPLFGYLLLVLTFF
jgi:hypothetical protein